MKVAKFDPNGQPLRASVSCVPNRNGSYTILLWEKNTNRVVEEYKGNFINTDDDSYFLRLPNSDQDGRLVEAIIVVAVPSGVGPSDVSLVVSQGDTELERDHQPAPPGSAGLVVDLYIQLEST